MAAVNRIQRTSIDDGWLKFNIGDNFGLYLIAIKGAKTEDDIMNIDDLKNVVLEIGIDSGITDTPIPVQRVNLKFNEHTIDGDANGITALGMTSKLPTADTYIRVVAFSTGLYEKTSGSMPISINTVTI